ncbi:MAG: acetylxylan esterase [Verrucomicrobia bacterium]|nr:acetylxylan esterase [Verrucomicrobiota bacterium]
MVLYSFLASTLLSSGFSLSAQTKFVPNYDESKVSEYSLPNPLVTLDGKQVANSKTWQKQRRPEILKLFETEVYGRAPQKKLKTRFEVTSVDKQALDGTATRKEVSVHFSGNGLKQRMDILIYLPNKTKGPAPLFLGLNFYGNHTAHVDPGITLSTNWMRRNPDKGIVNNRATEESRGTSAKRWPVETLLQRGYGLATIYYGDIVPDDSANGLPRGIHRLFSNHVSPAPGSEEWGAISAWAWGLSRAMDYFERDKAIDPKRVVVMGHSRLGKTALWTGALDPRFAVVISNNSGCGGASLSRRIFGETVLRINTSFPHWFSGNFKKYSDNENHLPVDQHMLIALIAPRPVYVASAEDDLWADPRGEFLSAQHAEPVYALFGKPGVGVEEMPALNQPTGHSIGYHFRTGKHDVTDFDWEQYLAFADRHFGQSKALKWVFNHGGTRMLRGGE